MKYEEFTRDTFFHGKIQLLQPRQGYRFSVDAPLLADFIKTKKSDDLLELGTGNGVISLLLSRKPFRSITAIEIQDGLAALARKNVTLNRMDKRIFIIRADLKDFQTSRKFDVVFSNPPYIRKNQGQTSVSPEKAVAKHELKCNIFDVMRKTAELLRQSGHADFIFPAKRRRDFFDAAGSCRLKTRALRPVHPAEDEESHLFLCSLDFTSTLPAELPPLVLFDREGNHTPEAKAIYSGREHASSF